MWARGVSGERSGQHNGQLEENQPDQHGSREMHDQLYCVKRREFYDENTDKTFCLIKSIN